MSEVLERSRKITEKSAEFLLSGVLKRILNDVDVVIKNWVACGCDMNAGYWGVLCEYMREYPDLKDDILTRITKGRKECALKELSKKRVDERKQMEEKERRADEEWIRRRRMAMVEIPEGYTVKCICGASDVIVRPVKRHKYRVWTVCWNCGRRVFYNNMQRIPAGSIVCNHKVEMKPTKREGWITSWCPVCSVRVFEYAPKRYVSL